MRVFISGLLICILLSSCYTQKPVGSLSRPDYNDRINVSNAQAAKVPTPWGVTFNVGLTAAGGYAGYCGNMAQRQTADSRESRYVLNTAVGMAVGASVAYLIARCSGVDKPKVVSQQQWLSLQDGGYIYLDGSKTDFRAMHYMAEYDFKVKTINDVYDFKKAFPQSSKSNDVITQAIKNLSLKREDYAYLLSSFSSNKISEENLKYMQQKYIRLSSNAYLMENARKTYPDCGVSEAEVDARREREYAFKEEGSRVALELAKQYMDEVSQYTGHSPKSTLQNYRFQNNQHHADLIMQWTAKEAVIGRYYPMSAMQVISSDYNLDKATLSNVKYNDHARAAIENNNVFKFVATIGAIWGGVQVGKKVYNEYVESKKPNLYVLAIEDKGWSSATNARAIVNTFKSENTASLFKTVSAETITDSEVTQENILDEIGKISQRATSDEDVFVIFFSGASHLSDEENRDLYVFKTKDRRGVGFKEILGKIRNAKCQIILCFESNYSGAIANDYYRIKMEERSALGQAKFTMLMSSSDKEGAYFKKDDNNLGCFTEAILKGLDGYADGYANAEYKKDGVVTLMELGNYVKRQVGKNSEGKQHPEYQFHGVAHDLKLSKLNKTD